MHQSWNTAWIIGASSGLGLELAKLLDGNVAHVAISARSQDKLKAVEQSSKSLVAYPLDVTDAKAVLGVAKAIENGAGPIDLAVLSAGVWHQMKSDGMDLKKLRSAVDVNYIGVMNAVDALLPGMLARGRGHIVIVASVAGYRGLPESIAYGPTKAALINAAETLKSELEPHGIKVSVVNPGFIDTPMTGSNTFPMPGIIPADVAARKLLSGLEKARFEIIFPRGFVYALKALRLAPNALFFWIVRNFILKNGD
jgi:short-subunit dehydrogenase